MYVKTLINKYCKFGKSKVVSFIIHYTYWNNHTQQLRSITCL